MPLLVLLIKAGLCIGALLIVVAVLWAISALFWGVIGGLLIWNHIVLAVFPALHAHLSFLQAFGAGACQVFYVFYVITAHNRSS